MNGHEVGAVLASLIVVWMIPGDVSFWQWLLLWASFDLMTPTGNRKCYR